MRGSEYVQQQQDEWVYQWSHYSDDESWLFEEWIHPRTIEDFRAQWVLDAGRTDLNTSELARSPYRGVSWRASGRLRHG